jgi:hypothetical protein
MREASSTQTWTCGSAHRGGEDLDDASDLLACPALTPQRDDLLDDLARRRIAQAARPRGAVQQTRRALGLKAIDPLGHNLGVHSTFGRCTLLGITKASLAPTWRG